jgi:hypothetical protein
MNNYVVEYLISKGIPLTVRNYIALAYLGDVRSLEDLGPEDRAEVDGLIEDGILVDTQSKQAN